ncbi:MAG: segregation/condensation protein A [Nanoarchaeota archaeon]|nr:segregation/condensation protein A [Nanoarchaeota archaeon]
MDENPEEKNKSDVKQDQIHDLLFNREVGWQEIIYDLINTEQLDPWNINILVLSEKYLEKVRSFEEADFFVSGKVLLAAALLLRIKSEILLNKYLKSIDEILFGKKDEVPSRVLERIELDELIPELIPKSPLPRFKKVTLQELMAALDKAIVTENRRIKKEIVNKNALRETGFLLPKRKFTISDKIKGIYGNLTKHFKEDEKRKRISFEKFAEGTKEDRLILFTPLLHLDHQKKVWLEQENHLDDFYIWLSETYFEHNPDPFADLKTEIEEVENLSTEKKKRLKKVEKEFENPLGTV